MDKEEKIKAIYDKIADKTLSFGCEVNYNNPEWVKHFYVWEWDFWWMLLWKETTIEWYRSCSIETEEWEDIENIWHPVMIWRCDLLIEKWPDYFDEWILILDLWEDKDKPIENQSERCIDHIYNLTLVSWK